jgi:hypothetical protein
VKVYSGRVVNSDTCDVQSLGEIEAVDALSALDFFKHQCDQKHITRHAPWCVEVTVRGKLATDLKWRQEYLRLTTKAAPTRMAGRPKKKRIEVDDTVNVEEL